MKIVISKSTITSINAQAFVAFSPAIQAIDPDVSILELATAFTKVELDDTHANHSVSEADGNYVVEINDELLFKYMRVYAKIVHVVTPFIKPFMALMKTVSDDLNDIQRFTDQKK